MIHATVNFAVPEPHSQRTLSDPRSPIPDPRSLLRQEPMRRSLKFAGVIYPPGSMSRVSNSDPDAVTAEERINKLELGLSLGSRGGRILTAEEFRSPESMDSSISSNSSVSSSSGGLGGEGDSGCGGGGWSNRGSDVVGNNASHSPNDMSHCQVVGWPPIRTCRRNNLVNMSRVTSSNVKAATHKEMFLSYRSNATGGNDDGRKATHAGKSHFVKVNIDGDLIGRKVDLHTHFSYETLTFALEAMFHKPILSIYASKNGMFSKQLDGSSEFVIIYEDEDGDWMLVGDVPWGMFLRTARRLRIMKWMDACGLGASLTMKQN